MADETKPKDDQVDTSSTSEETTQEQQSTETTPPPEETTQEQQSTETTPPPEEEVKVVKTTPVKVEPSYLSFFNQYIDQTKKKNSDLAIKALNNAIKAMFKDKTDKAFNGIFKLYNENKDILTIEKALQSIATLNRQDRAVVEVVTTIYRALASNDSIKRSIDLEKARPVVKNEAFINWCAKKFNK